MHCSFTENELVAWRPLMVLLQRKWGSERKVRYCVYAVMDYFGLSFTANSHNATFNSFTIVNQNWARILSHNTFSFSGFMCNASHVTHYNHISRYENCIVHNMIHVLREVGNLLLSGAVFEKRSTQITQMWVFDMIWPNVRTCMAPGRNVWPIKSFTNIKYNVLCHNHNPRPSSPPLNSNIGSRNSDQRVACKKLSRNQ